MRPLQLLLHSVGFREHSFLWSHAALTRKSVFANSSREFKALPHPVVSNERPSRRPSPGPPPTAGLPVQGSAPMERRNLWPLPARLERRDGRKLLPDASGHFGPESHSQGILVSHDRAASLANALEDDLFVKGGYDLKSTTSMERPRFSARRASSKARYTVLPHATMVTSAPASAHPAAAKWNQVICVRFGCLAPEFDGTAPCAQGTPPDPQTVQRPLSALSRRQHTRKDHIPAGTCAKAASTQAECQGPPLIYPPTAIRTTTGHVHCP